MTEATTQLDPLFDITPILEPLAAGTLILTPNLRLSRKIRDAWTDHQLAAGAPCWTPANVLPLEAWIEECWLQLVDAAYPPALAGSLATPHQALWLWEQVIEQTDNDAQVQPQAIAPLTGKTWALVRQWQLDTAILSRAEHAGSQTLCLWGAQWEKSLSKHKLISLEKRTAIVAQGFREQRGIPEQEIHLVGFQTLSPSHLQLVENASHSLKRPAMPTRQGAIQQWAATDIDHEIATAARWAKDCASRNPRARIGIVVPDLTALRSKVERLFMQAFDPAWSHPQREYRPLPFNISAATPLGKTPLVNGALQLLNLNRQILESQALCNLVQSPFWGQDSQEGEIRSQIIAAIYDCQLEQLSPGQFRKLVAQAEAYNLKVNSDSNLTTGSDAPAESSLLSRLTRLATEQRQLNKQQSFSQWRQTFEHQLNLLEWPGERTLNSLEYQQQQHWYDLLDNYEKLDQVASPCTAEQALRQLSQLANDTSFQPETPDAQVQVLGTLEAAGLSFSHLWILQMDDRHWPPAPEPNPLLPSGLQRQLGMPKACPQKELELSQAQFELLCVNSDDVMVSYARQEGDIHFQPSSLLSALPSTVLPEATTNHPWSAEIAASAILEMIEDNQGPPLPDTLTKLANGAGFLAAQAGCPFNGFAQFRLGAAPLPPPYTGLTPAERGNLLHHSLDNFWRHISSHGELLALDDNGLQRRLQEAIDGGFARFQQQAGIRAQALGQRYLELEKQRLLGLLTRWLEEEKQRPDFTLIATELPVTVTLDKLTIKLRIDRLDQVADGSRVIIDYKTGSPLLKPLVQDRLVEPQLPLYALSQGEPLAAIGYGIIQAKQVKFTGLSASESSLPGCQTNAKNGLPDTWELTLEKWRNSLILITNEIKYGLAGVFFHHRNAQQYGAVLEPLNRWPERERLSPVHPAETELAIPVGENQP